MPKAQFSNWKLIPTKKDTFFRETMKCQQFTIHIEYILKIMIFFKDLTSKQGHRSKGQGHTDIYSRRDTLIYIFEV